MVLGTKPFEKGKPAFVGYDLVRKSVAVEAKACKVFLGMVFRVAVNMMNLNGYILIACAACLTFAVGFNPEINGTLSVFGLNIPNTLPFVAGSLIATCAALFAVRFGGIFKVLNSVFFTVNPGYGATLLVAERTKTTPNPIGSFLFVTFGNLFSTFVAHLFVARYRIAAILAFSVQCSKGLVNSVLMNIKLPGHGSTAAKPLVGLKEQFAVNLVSSGHKRCLNQVYMYNGV